MSGRLGIHVLCEGYNDRDFIAAYLEHTGWLSHRRRTSDTFGAISPGQFLFRRTNAVDSPELLLRQCGGISNLVDVAKGLVKLAKTKHQALLLVDDLDDTGTSGPKQASSRRLDALADALGLARPNGPHAELGEVRCAGVSWHTAASPGPGLPAAQTLERLISTAFATRDQAAAQGVEKWLRQDPPTGESGGKAYAHSYFAKWVARSTNTDFYRAIWRQADLAPLLERLVDGCGMKASLHYLSA